MLLVLLVLLPASGLIKVRADQFSDLGDRRGRLDRIESRAQERIDALTLRGALYEEWKWRTVLLAVDSLGADESLANQLLGLDVGEVAASAVADVDQLVADGVGAPTVTVEDISTLRGRLDGTVVSSRDAFEVVGARLDSAGLAAADELVELAEGIPDGDRLIARMRTTELLAEGHSNLSAQFLAYFGSRFSVEIEPVLELQRLAALRSSFRSMLAELAENPASSQAIQTTIDELRSDSALTSYQAVVDEHLAVAITSGLVAEEGDLFANAFADIDRIITVFDSSTTSIEDWLIATESSGSDLLDTVVDNVSAANADISHTRRSVFIQAAVMIVAIVVVTMIIRRPIRRLTALAALVRDGRPIDIAPSGPSEVHHAGQVLVEAGSNQELIRLQAVALADGKLDDPVLQLTASGDAGRLAAEATRALSRSIAETRSYQAQLSYQATHDGLTGLRNRPATVEALAGAMSRMRSHELSTAVLFIDLDEFKPINDTYGHAAGDQALIEISKRLLATTRQGDVVGRMGGDEFVIVYESATSAEEVDEFAQRVRGTVRESIWISGMQVNVGCSIGISMTSPDDGITDLTQPPADLARAAISHADLAVYAAKAAGRNAVKFCTDEMRAADTRLQDAEAALRHVVADGGLELHFQPVIGPDHAVVGFEALARWRQADGTMAMPDDFIAIAERSDLIVSLDRWVIDEAARTLADWQENSVLSGLWLAVNVSSRHLDHPEVAAHVLDPLELHEIEPILFMIEVTETAAVNDIDRTRERLQRIRRAGVRVAIDDFGTGHSSLTHLSSFEVDVLKLDRSWVSEVDEPGSKAEHMLRLMVASGHGLGLRVTAEGIENADQAEAMLAMGADFLQGWHFSRAVPLDEVVATVRSVGSPAHPPSRIGDHAPLISVGPTGPATDLPAPVALAGTSA